MWNDNQKPKELGNPAAVGLAGFAMTTWLSSMINAGWFSIESNSLVFAMALAYGGGGQVLAGMVEFFRGNTFGGTASLSFGCFWISYVIFFRFFDSSAPPAFVGWYFCLWGIFALYMWIATLRSPRALQTVFLLLWITLFFAASGEWIGARILVMVSGYVGLCTAAAALYYSAAIVINDAHERVILPIGEFK
ncbi:acetate uptake transporter [Pandoraea pneumonica]|uniref:acetate uptake transporter n=1 Tax=Pandoraea pneumonica TaxID=2508299 RepID=UPI003CE882F5